MMLKVLVALVVLTGCCCWAARIKRQEDGEFWWLKKDVESKNDEQAVEVKINSPDEAKLASIKQGNQIDQLPQKHYFKKDYFNRKSNRFGCGDANFK